MGNSVFVRFWVARSLRTFHVVLAVAAVACHVIGGFSGEVWLPACGDVIMVVGILHYFIHTNLHRKYLFSTDYHKMYSLPDKKITRINMIFMVILVIAVCLGMVLARELYSGTLIAKLQLLFMFLLNRGFGVIFDTDGLGRDEVLVQHDQTLLDALNGVARQSDRPWEATANSIQTIVIIIGLLLILILCIVAVTGLVRRALRSSRTIEEEKIWRETGDREEKLQRNTLQRTGRLGSSPADRIRRLYRNRIRHHRKRRQSIPSWMTPTEIETLVELSEEASYRLLHVMYEKARYSESGCTDRDVKQAKGLDI